MAEARPREPKTVTCSQTVTSEEEENPTLVLRLKKPKSDRKVSWTSDTIDNEMLNKKKSKCCCIYERPKLFGESSDEDDDNCTDHCRGHKKKCYKSLPNGEGTNADRSYQPDNPVPAVELEKSDPKICMETNVLVAMGNIPRDLGKHEQIEIGLCV